MKIVIAFLETVFCLTFFGCGYIYGPVEEVKAFANEKGNVIVQMGKKIEENPTEAGVDEARKIFEARKDDLVAKRKAISAKPHGLNGDWLTMFYQSKRDDNALFNKISEKLPPNGAAIKKFAALRHDFDEAVK